MMRWEPDTCGCVIIIEVTDSVKFIEMERICEEHNHLNEHDAYLSASKKNKDKNLEIDRLEENKKNNA
jgi:hypothetical protein